MKYLVTGNYAIFYMGIEQEEKQEIYESVFADNVSHALMIILDAICLTIAGNPSRRWMYSLHENIKVQEIE